MKRRRILDRDLSTTPATLELYDRLADLGEVPRSEHARLEFLALAEHCRRQKPVRLGNLFYVLMRDERYHLITQAEEDDALRKLKALDMDTSRSYGCERIDSILFRVLVSLKKVVVTAAKPTGWNILSPDAMLFARAAKQRIDLDRLRRGLGAKGWIDERIETAEREWRAWRRKAKASA
jgi:hypothetical protein